MNGDPIDILAWGMLIAGMLSVYAGFKDKSAWKFAVNEVAKSIGSKAPYSDDSLSHWPGTKYTPQPTGPVAQGTQQVTASDVNGLPAANSDRPWSIFNQTGGDATAVTWAGILLHDIGAPVSAGNVKFVYDWEKSEGGGGMFNPLNQGPDPNHPEYTSTGQQYGGGASDYTSWQTGLQGAADYLNMPQYSAILNDLKNDDGNQATQDLWNSPWASSHYGNGANWNNSDPPSSIST